MRRKNARAMRRLRAIIERETARRRAAEAARDGRRRVDCRVACPAACASFRSSSLALLAVLALAACGDSHTRVTTGTYAGESGQERALPERRPAGLRGAALARAEPVRTSKTPQYLQGLTPPQRKLEPGQEWFGVFIQVYNNSSHAAPGGDRLHDHRHPGKRLHADRRRRRQPVRLPRRDDARQQPAAGADTIAANGPTQGALLLFKIEIVSLDNRPLELKIVDPRTTRRDGLGGARRLVVARSRSAVLMRSACRPPRALLGRPARRCRRRRRL